MSPACSMPVSSAAHRIPRFEDGWQPVLDRAAERIVLIDEQAREIPADAALHLMTGLVAKHRKEQGRIVIPANVSRVAERIAGAYGVTVERAGITQAGLIEGTDSPTGGRGSPLWCRGYRVAEAEALFRSSS